MDENAGSVNDGNQAGAGQGRKLLIDVFDHLIEHGNLPIPTPQGLDFIAHGGQHEGPW